MPPVDGHPGKPPDGKGRGIEGDEPAPTKHRKQLPSREVNDEEIGDDLKQVARVVQEPEGDERPKAARPDPEFREPERILQAKTNAGYARGNALDEVYGDNR